MTQANATDRIRDLESKLTEYQRIWSEQDSRIAELESMVSLIQRDSNVLLEQRRAAQRESERWRAIAMNLIELTGVDQI